MTPTATGTSRVCSGEMETREGAEERQDRHGDNGTCSLSVVWTFRQLMVVPRHEVLAVPKHWPQMPAVCVCGSAQEMLLCQHCPCLSGTLHRDLSR
jgi:hypothetical protein